MDFSLAGRAGASAVLPVLAACGVQACALPTALFSTHTGGFGTPVRQNEANFCRDALAHFARESIHFDAVYTGYLFGREQFALAETAFAQYPEALRIVDPAMADDGKLYSGLDQSTVTGMQNLAAQAHLVTPNFTESALLTGADPAAPGDETVTRQYLAALCAHGANALITSVPTADGFVTAGCVDGVPFTLPSRRVPQRYPGTGDAFTAAVCGLWLQGTALPAATQRAAAFVERAAAHSYANNAEARHGLWLEPFLHSLFPSEETTP